MIPVSFGPIWTSFLRDLDENYIHIMLVSVCMVTLALLIVEVQQVSINWPSPSVFWRVLEFLQFHSWKIYLTAIVVHFSVYIAYTVVTKEDMHAFNQDSVPVDIHCMKLHLSAPDLTSRQDEAGNSKDTFNDSETEV